MNPPYPTHPLAGESGERQSVGLPGHCERCAEVGHVRAHPSLGCGDVGCEQAHSPGDPRDRADRADRADRKYPAPSPDSLSAGTLSERVELRHRSAAERCLYLAAKLAEHGGGSLAVSLAVSLALPVLAGEIKDTADRARQLVAERDAWASDGRWDVAANYAWDERAAELLREVSR
jgi:hypothetical protein